MPHPEFLKQPTDEILEEIWSRREDGECAVAAILQGPRTADGAAAVLDRLAAEGLVRHRRRSVSPDRGRGGARAGGGAGHRLAERLLVDVLGVSRGARRSVPPASWSTC